LRDWILAAVVSLTVAVAVLSPFFFLGTASGHDIAFHMASWLDAAGQWKQGILLPRWAEWPNYGFGEPRFIFYPPLSWLFGALLGSVLPWTAVTPVYIICVQTFAGLSAYGLLRSQNASRQAACIGAACFAANPYALTIVYARSDFAELLAIAFFPLMLRGVFVLCNRPTALGGSWFRSALSFALPFAAIWLSNAPTAVIATYSAACLFGVFALQARSARPLVEGGAAMCLGFALAAFYIVPAIYEQRWVNISGALAGGLGYRDNFLYARTADAEHDAFNRVGSNIAVLLFLWFVAGWFWAWKAKRRQNTNAARVTFFWPLSTLTLAAILLMFPLTSPLWRCLPELRFMQFPWRWMSIVALSAVVFTSATLVRKWNWVWFAAAVLAFAGAASYLVKHSWWDTEDMPTLQAALSSGAGFEGTDEYDPLGDDHTDLPQNAPRAKFVAPSSAGGDSTGSRELFVDDWTAEHRALRAVTHERATLALRLLDYPAWHITVNGHAIKPHHPEGTAQILIPLAQGESRIEVTFRRTLDRTVGGWISAVTAIGSVIVLLVGRARRPKRTTPV
jgi:uncharacterized membrane protein